MPRPVTGSARSSFSSVPCHWRPTIRPAAKSALVIVDMPFPSNLLGVHKAIENAGRILKETRCQAVKLEGGADPQAFADSVEDPACRKAILQAQAAGLSKAQIVDLLMGASDVPDPDPEELTVPQDGPSVVE